MPVEIRTPELYLYSHQKKLFVPTNVTNEIYEASKHLFDGMRRYGNFAVFRGVLADRELSPMEGGSGAEDYQVMSSML